MPLNEAETAVLDVLSKVPIDVDEILDLTGLSPAEGQSALVTLEVAGAIARLPKSCFVARTPEEQVKLVLTWKPRTLDDLVQRCRTLTPQQIQEVLDDLAEVLPTLIVVCGEGDSRTYRRAGRA